MKSILFIFLTVFCTSSILAMETTPTGFWKTIDDVTGKPKAIVEIWQSTDKMLHGKVRKIFLDEGQSETAICKACTGDKHNKRIIGLTILENLKANKDKQNEWQNGAILDPKNGKTYHCNIRLVENGKKLQVRGFVGLPLFGRTQTWQKVANSDIA